MATSPAPPMRRPTASRPEARPAPWSGRRAAKPDRKARPGTSQTTLESVSVIRSEILLAKSNHFMQGGHRPAYDAGWALPTPRTTNLLQVPDVLKVQSVSVQFPSDQGSRSGLIVMIQEPFSEYMIRTPLKVYGPALPGAQEWNPTSLKGREGVVRSWGGWPLADHDGSGPGPGIEPRGIGGLTAVVRGQHQVDRLGLRLGDQLDDTQLIKVAGEQKVPAPMRNVKHQAAGVVRSLGVPVWWWMEHRELRRALVPG